MSQQISNPSFPRVAYFNKKRLFVVDDAIQPNDPAFMYAYSVQGHTLCVRKRADDNPKLSYDVPYETFAFAMEQYMKWQSGHLEDLDAILADGSNQVSPLPLMKKQCPTCEGRGDWMDRVNKCSYGVTQEETNIIERCDTCRGACYVEDFL